MIIIEGPDGSGKSFLARQLAVHFRTEVFHSGGPVSGLKELEERIHTQLNQLGLIMDRCSVFSEPVYGLVIRGYSLLDISEFSKYVKEIQEKNWGIIYCTGDWPVVTGKQWKSDEHMKAVECKRDKLKEIYEFVMGYAADQLNCPIVHVNTNYLAEQSKKGNMLPFHKIAWAADRRVT